MSPQLKQFYRDMQEWIDAGCPETNHHGFVPSYGLCANLEIFLTANGWTTDEETPYELEQHFKSAGLPSNFPFNSRPGELTFAGEIKVGKRYKNPRRLAWVKEHAE